MNVILQNICDFHENRSRESIKYIKYITLKRVEKNSMTF